MDLGIKDVAELLQVNEKLIQDWVKQGTIPHYILQEEARFSKMEIEKWIVDNIGVSKTTGAKGMAHFNLFRAMHKGGIIEGVDLDDKEDLIREVMNQKAASLDLDANVVTDLLLDREALMPTSVGQGIAIPHTRDFLLNKGYDVVITVFPKEPIEYGALDGKKVHTLFFLLACSDKRHLQLLAKLGHFCSDSKSLDLLQAKPKENQLLDFVKDFETGFE